MQPTHVGSDDMEQVHTRIHHYLSFQRMAGMQHSTTKRSEREGCLDLGCPHRSTTKRCVNLPLAVWITAV